MPDELWPKHESVWWTRAFDGSQSWIAADGSWLQDAPRAAPRLERWLRFLDKRFGTARFEVAARQRLMVEWICDEIGSFTWQIEVTHPSFHECLEARLELRTWLKENTSPQQRRWLIPP